MRQKLAAQPFGVLRVLLENSQQLVTREELHRCIWPKDTFVDYELALKKAVSRIREVLGDSADNPRFVETLSRRGYRFIAPVTDVTTEREIAPVDERARDSIAVLPFANISADPENEFFADGMTEEIINALAQIDQLYVVARSSVFSFKGKYIDVREVGKLLGVRTVLEGGVRRSDDSLRITVQLVNAADGYHLWSQGYNREMKDVFSMQDEIARSIAEKLKVTLARDPRQPLVKAGTDNLEAYEFYLKGRALLSRRGMAIPRALECFERAITLDSKYALAWAGIADSYTTLGYYGLAPPDTCMPKALHAARSAVVLDGSCAEAHNSLAMACLMGAWDKEEAEREFVRALELNPNYIQARDWYALFYLQCAAGRLDDGVAQAKIALESDPLSAYANCLVGFTCSVAGQYEEGIRACKRAVDLDSESFIARWCHQMALYYAGRFDEAIAVGELALAMSGRHPWAMGTLAGTFASCNKRSDAEAVYAELLGRARRSYVPPSVLALAAAAADIQDQAIGHACQAFEVRDPISQIFFSKLYPASTPLRLDPRFQKIQLDMGWLLR